MPRWEAGLAQTGEPSWVHPRRAWRGGPAERRGCSSVSVRPVLSVCMWSHWSVRLFFPEVRQQSSKVFLLCRFASCSRLQELELACCAQHWL